LGTGSNRNCYNPTRVKIEAVELIAAGENHSLFVSKGQIFGCGDNTSGQVSTLFNKKYVLDPAL
jgi:alpha-tubulin suppressor-like RCC1 family protein